MSPPVANTLEALDVLPERIAEMRRRAGVAAPPDAPTDVADLPRPLRTELHERLHALGYLGSRRADRHAKKVRRAWETFRHEVTRPPLALPVPDQPTFVDPIGWQALLDVTVLERPLPDGLGETTLGFRARRHRMGLLGLPADFVGAPRFPGLYIALFDLRLPEAVALGGIANAVTDDFVAPFLDDLDGLASRILAHLERLPEDERSRLEADNGAFLTRVAFIDAVATGWIPLPRAQQARGDFEIEESLFAGPPEPPDPSDPARDFYEGPRPRGRGPAPVDLDLEHDLLVALAPPGSAPPEPLEIEESLAPPLRVRTTDLRRLVAERVPDEIEESLGVRFDLDARIEAALDLQNNPNLPKLLSKAKERFGGSLLWQGLERVGEWLREQWRKVSEFFQRIVSDTKPREDDQKFWQAALKWISVRLTWVFQSVQQAGRSLWVWLSGRGQLVEHGGALVGAFEVRADFDLLLASDGTPAGAAALSAALAAQRDGFRLATDIFGTVLRLIVIVSTGGTLSTWRLVLLLIREVRRLISRQAQVDPPPMQPRLNLPVPA